MALIRKYMINYHKHGNVASISRYLHYITKNKQKESQPTLYITKLLHETKSTNDDTITGRQQSLKNSRSKEIEERKELLGVTVKSITQEMADETMDFVWENFFQNEPFSASMQIKRGWFVDSFRWFPLVKKGESFAAVNREGRIVGVILGRQLSSTKNTDFSDKIGFYIYVYGAQLFGSANNLTRIIWLRKHLNYDPWKFMQKTHSNKIYENITLAVDKKLRGKGIGEIMIHDTYKTIKECGCEYTYGLYSSKFSTAISQNIGEEEVVSSARYEDLKDPAGRKVFPEYGTHTLISIRANKL